MTKLHCFAFNGTITNGNTTTNCSNNDNWYDQCQCILKAIGEVNKGLCRPLTPGLIYTWLILFSLLALCWMLKLVLLFRNVSKKPRLSHFLCALGICGCIGCVFSLSIYLLSPDDADIIPLLITAALCITSLFILLPLYSAWFALWCASLSFTVSKQKKRVFQIIHWSIVISLVLSLAIYSIVEGTKGCQVHFSVFFHAIFAFDITFLSYFIFLLVGSLSAVWYKFHKRIPYFIRSTKHIWIAHVFLALVSLVFWILALIVEITFKSNLYSVLYFCALFLLFTAQATILLTINSSSSSSSSPTSPTSSTSSTSSYSSSLSSSLSSSSSSSLSKRKDYPAVSFVPPESEVPLLDHTVTTHELEW